MTRIVFLVGLYAMALTAFAQSRDVNRPTDFTTYSYSPYSTGASGGLYYNPYPSYSSPSGYYYSTYEPGRAYAERNWSYGTPTAGWNGVPAGTEYPPTRAAAAPGSRPRQKTYYNFWY